MIKLSLLIFLSAILAISYAQTRYTYKTVGNLSIEAAVWVPNVTISSKYPVVFVIHGGGYVTNSCVAGDLSTQELDEMLARGWAVVSIDYRLAPYVFLPDIVEDMQDAYNWVRNELVNIVNINPNAIAIWGDSAGAGLTVMAGYKLSPRPQAIISFYPYYANFTDIYAYNPSTPVGQQLIDAANALRQPLTEYTPLTSNDPRWGLFSIAQSEQKAGWLFTTSDPNATTDSIIAEIEEYSAVYNVDAEYPPTYLIHGLEDTTVPYNQSVEMANALASVNVTYELVLVPGVGHAFDLGGVNQAFWNQYLRPIFNFVQSYISDDFASTTEEIYI